MDIKKVNWTTDGDNFSMSMEMTKVGKEKRLVTGWASLDNEDRQNDVVLAEASIDAFKKFAGNIREMHQNIAVGRMISYKPDQYYDPETKKFYNGIMVTAYISKGAQDTWEKVLDGTLQAFSIKGPIRDSYTQLSKDSSKPVRFVKAYDLDELSLVDSGGNQLANIVSFSKAADGSVSATGTITSLKSENVFWCKPDEIAKTSSDEKAQCPNGHTMENIGWIEYKGDDKNEKIVDVIAKYNAANEGGVDVADKEKTEVADDGKLEETEAVEGGAAAVEAEHSTEAVADNAETKEVEKVASNSEVEELSLGSVLEELKNSFAEGLSKSQETTQEAIAKVEKVIGELDDSLGAKVEELEKKYTELTENLADLEKKHGEVSDRVEGVVKGTAIKKSGDLGGSTGESLEKREQKEESVWGGMFLSNLHR